MTKLSNSNFKSGQAFCMKQMFSNLEKKCLKMGVDPLLQGWYNSVRPGSYLFRSPSYQTVGPWLHFTIETKGVSLSKWTILV